MKRTKPLHLKKNTTDEELLGLILLKYDEKCQE